MTTIGTRLRAERRRLGLSQSQLAELGGVRRNAQANYEADLRSPNADYLRAAVLNGVDILLVLTGDRTAGAHLSAAVPTQSEAGVEQRFGGSPLGADQPGNGAEKLLLEAARSVSVEDLGVLLRIAQSLAGSK